MPNDLVHPNHVRQTLTAFDALPDEGSRLAAIKSGMNGRRLSPEILMRLLRRSRVEGDTKQGGAAAEALIQWVGTWVRRKYFGLSPADREDMVQGLVLRIWEVVRNRAEIDWWEITFQRNLERAAADHYDSNRPAPPDIELCDVDDAGEADDDGEFSTELLSQAHIHARVSRACIGEERTMFYALFLSGIPIKSSRAPTDLVRLLGKPEGTLRETKTVLKRKLQVILKEEAL